MNKEDIVDLMLETKVIPLYYESDPEIGIKLLDACYSGGARVLEYTARGAAAELVFQAMRAHCNEHYPELALGVGSIATPEQAENYIRLGADFLISPFIDNAIAQKCSELDVLWMGGCATLTEMHQAYQLGMPIMKAFPGNILGPDFIKAAKAPCPWFQIMPTGGVKPEEANLRSWFNAGASCVGMGSKLFVKTPSGEYDYDQIVSLLKESIRIAKST